MKPNKPNILLVMADQLAVPTLPFHGHPLVQAPHLSRLAQNGVVFDSAYCNFPICAPSRFSMLSGRLPHSIGAYDNAADFAADVPTYAHYLRRLGALKRACRDLDRAREFDAARQAWLSEKPFTAEDFGRLAVTAPDRTLALHRVSPDVNRVACDDPRLLEPVVGATDQPVEQFGRKPR